MVIKLIHTGIVNLIAVTYIFSSPSSYSQDLTKYETSQNAINFLGEDFMKSSNHQVNPKATKIGYMLEYEIINNNKSKKILGTKQAKIHIQEIQATEVLRNRSTGLAILDSAKNRTTNLIETPVRVVKNISKLGSKVKNFEDLVMFIPKHSSNTIFQLAKGFGEFGVTIIRISKGAASTKCSGYTCVKKAGTDIWSGFNSLAGKHNASRRLHSEFNTDPETNNKVYRKQIDRLAYANAYTGTTIKLGAGQAGIDYLSDAFMGVGYYNNAEFIVSYEDAHRQRNNEKEILKGWGADTNLVNFFYKNKTYTKKYRRRLFKSLDTITDKKFALKLFSAAAKENNRTIAMSKLRTIEHIAYLTSNRDIVKYEGSSELPFIVEKNGSSTLVIYADHIHWTKKFSSQITAFANIQQLTNVDILGYSSLGFKKEAKIRDIIVNELNQ
jgi:hypothetical protein